MNICPEPTQTIGVNRNVAQNDFVAILILLDNVRTYIVHIREIVLNLKDVMIALDEHNSTAKTPQHMHATTIDRDITQKINPVGTVNKSIVTTDKGFIVLFDVLEDSSSDESTLIIHEVEDVAMSEMMVSTYPGSA